MRKVRIGVLGAGRGRMMIKYCALAGNAELVAICDNHVPFLERVQEQMDKELESKNVSYYTDFI